jgi:TolB protein
VNLTNDPGWDMLPAWSPDGSRIAFARGTTEDGVPKVEVYVMDADGSNVMNLTRHPAQDSSPTWSPDGRRIAFSTNRGGNHEIYVMEADGSRVANLTHHPAADTQPAWWR